MLISLIWTQCHVIVERLCLGFMAECLLENIFLGTWSVLTEIASRSAEGIGWAITSAGTISLAWRATKSCLVRSLRFWRANVFSLFQEIIEATSNNIEITLMFLECIILVIRWCSSQSIVCLEVSVNLLVHVFIAWISWFRMIWENIICLFESRGNAQSSSIDSIWIFLATSTI